MSSCYLACVKRIDSGSHMRLTHAAMFLCCLAQALTGCREQTSVNTSGSTDVSSKAPVDKTAESGESCDQVITCARGCAGVSACQSACAAKGSAKAQASYQALFACAYGQCSTSSDAGTAACSSESDTSAACQTCVPTAALGTGCRSPFRTCKGLE